MLRGFDATPQEREDYLKAAPWKEGDREVTLSPERMAEFEAAEEFILTVTANGYGKRTSAYEYRRTNRGGQGITNIVTSDRNGPVVASFPAHNGEQLMLVTDQAKLIRTTVGDIRVTGRNTQGVTSSASPTTSMSSRPPGSRKATRKRWRLGTGGDIAPDTGAVDRRRRRRRPGGRPVSDAAR